MFILDDHTSEIYRALAAQDKIYPLNDAIEVMDKLMALDTKSNSLDDAGNTSKLSHHGSSKIRLSTTQK